MHYCIYYAILINLHSKVKHLNKSLYSILDANWVTVVM